MRMYNISQAKSLHKKYAPSKTAFDLVYTHCLIVHDIAAQLIDTNNLLIDRDLVLMGALLHDIGAYTLIDSDGVVIKGASYVRHGVEGEAILAKENYSIELQRIASHHTGVGITKEDILTQQIPIPMNDYVAESDEELLIMYADKFHSKSHPPQFNSYEWYMQYVERFGKDKPPKFNVMAEKFGKPNLKSIQIIYKHPIR